MNKNEFDLFDYMVYMNATERAGKKAYAPSGGIDTVWTLFVLGVLLVSIVMIIMAAPDYIEDTYRYIAAIAYLEKGSYEDAIVELYEIENDVFDVTDLIYYCRARFSYEDGFIDDARWSVKNMTLQYVPSNIKEELKEFQRLLGVS